MYVGLFLTPWLLMYALSTVVFNHWQRINGWYGGQMETKFEKEKDLPYSRSFAPGTSSRTEGEEILRELHLSGSFGVNDADEDRLVINRRDPITPRRITWLPKEKKLIVERQAFTAPHFLTTVHSQVGYTNTLTRIKLWAVTVDLTAFATVLLTLSGFWMWWELKVTRRWGAFFIALGFGLFGVFLAFA
jgi:hypothetical protein